ncbi:MBG domain-containing protein [Pelagicoccus sp. SDUM812005]|uniref:MBG domain-containing protein n=1 Tax=Pelagicoccus sp. SDUM812005 TaxID=3041257 RepID=UPI00280E4CC4|nr:MBG domain-containing protein [Pelagicoccus sp. SDUM812005]MDQ8183550.1 MBG domain-containing protein [Pelagicoccus sp. SDUM812005]
MKTEFSHALFLSLATASTLWGTQVAIEQPEVIAGQVSFEGLQSDHAQINQFTDKAIVDYFRFDLMEGGSVHFQLPSEQAAILNRITGADPSMLNGSVTGNGQVFFVNPAGVTFGPDSVVRMDTFMAIAGQIQNEDFLAGQLNFDLTGQVSNFGSIEALGDVGLFGQQVLNTGDIVSKSGVSILAAGDKVMLRANGSSLAVELSASEAPVQEGVALDNSGAVSGDEVMFSSGDAYSVALSHSGSVKAKQSAKLYSDGGRIEVSGEVLAQDPSGAGRIEIGGTDMGGPGAPSASSLEVTETARIDASAVSEGEGGHVVLYSKGLTSMRGQVSALGAGSGKGGFVEVSGSELDAALSTANVQLGKGGSLLIDPTDVTIDATAASNYETQLQAGTDVTVTTSSGGTDAGDITLASSIDNFGSTGVGSLTLNADNDIIINALLDNGDGSIAMNAANDITLNEQVLTGNVGAGATIEITALGNLTFNGSGGVSLFGDTNVKLSANRLVNNIGAGAISLAGTGFWQMVLPHWETQNHDYGGLTSGNKAVYGSAGTSLAAISKNEYHFAAAPELGIAVNDDSKTYGEAPASLSYQGYTIDPDTIVDASKYGNVFTQDTAANTVDDSSIVYSTAGSPTTAAAGDYSDLDISGFVSLNGYTFDVTPGTFTVNKRPIQVTANDRERIYGDSLALGTSEFTYIDSFDGGGDTTLPNGEVLTTVVLGSATSVATTTDTDVGVYADEVTVGTLSGTGGFDADNYELTGIAGDLEVLVRPVTVTATEQNKFYGQVASLDGTAIAITDKDGDSILPHGEQIVSAGMTYAFGPDLGASTIAPVGTTNNVIEPTSVTGASGFDVSNYDITFANGDFRIDARPVTITANEQSKQYGQTLTLDTTDFTLLDDLTSGSSLPNFESIDTVSLSSLTGIDASTTASVGTYADELKISGVATSSNGFNASNYAITFVTGDLTIDPRQITLSANDQARLYGDSSALLGTEFTLEDLDGGSLPNGESIDTVTLASANSADVTTDLDVGRYSDDLTITGQSGSGGFVASNYAIDYVAGDFVVNARPITVTALEQSKRYGEVVSLDPTEIDVLDKDGDSSLPHGEQIVSAMLAYEFGTDLGASTTESVGTTTDAIRPTAVSGASGFKVSNYEITFANGDYRIDPRPITVSANEQSKQYGQTLSLDPAAFSVLDTLTSTSVLPNGETIDTVAVSSTGGIDASTTANVGTYVDDIAISAVDATSNGFAVSNYDITFVEGDLSVTPRQITLTASEQSRHYGDTLALDGTAFTVQDLDGGDLPNGETIDTVSLASANDADVTTDLNVGTYVDDLSITGQSGSNGFVASNYDISYVEGDFVVDARPITVAALEQSKIYGEVETLDPSVISVTDKDGDSALPHGEQIVSAILTFAFGTDLGLSTTASVGTTVDAILPTGVNGDSGFSVSNYAITFVSGDYRIDARPITVLASQQSKQYGETLDLDGTEFNVFDTLTTTSTLPNGELIDEVSLVSLGGIDASTTANAGIYADDISITGITDSSNGFAESNYDITYVTGALQVKPREVTLIANEQARLYGDTLSLDDAAFTIQDLDGGDLPNGESIDSVVLASTDSLDTDTTANVGLYADDLVISDQSGSNGYLASNYNFTYVAGDMRINKRPISLSANSQEKIYGETYVLDGTAFTLEDTYGGATLPNGEQVDTVDLVSAAGVQATDTDAATYSGDLSITGQTGSNGFDASNYEISYGAGDYTVNRRALTIDLLDQSRFFSETWDLDRTAFTVFDPLSGGSALPNGERVSTVSFLPVGNPGLRSLPGLYPNALDADAAQGVNGFKATNYAITFIPGDLEVKNYPAPAIVPGELFPSGQDFFFGGKPWQGLKQGAPALSLNGLPELLASPAWQGLSREEQERVLRRLGEADGAEEFSEELLEYLIADAKQQY